MAVVRSFVLYGADRIFTSAALAFSSVAKDPHWNQLLLFNEYFHGDTGKGLGASHQTGWTGLIARLIVGGMGRFYSSNVE